MARPCWIEILIVVWSNRAATDRNAQLDYTLEHNFAAAIEQGDCIGREVAKLGDFPQLGRRGRYRDTRELVIQGTPFIVIYRIRPRLQRIEIIRLLHGAQSWPPADR